jgi:glycosyltransferase involved in cell wall biosynthesis
VGDVVPNDLPSYYGLADVFVIPSLEEVWGLVINEAALASLPIVATSCCGAAADLLRADENGYLVPPGDAAALEKAMAKILADPARARHMGEVSRRLVERCTPAGVASTLAKAARLAVASRRNP